MHANTWHKSTYFLNIIFIEEHNGNAICLAGDFNTDVSRHSPHTTELLDFCENENLQLLVKNNISSVDYTFESACGSKSCIDQIIVTDNISRDVLSYDNITDVNNFSDHLPVVVKFRFCCPYIVSHHGTNVQKPQWFKANPNDILRYKNVLDSNLDKFVNNDNLSVCDCTLPLLKRVCYLPNKQYLTVVRNQKVVKLLCQDSVNL